MLYASTVKLILSLPARAPAPSLPRRLDGLFADLAKPAEEHEAHETEDLIWALWIDHPEKASADRMDQAIRAMVTDKSALAEDILTALIDAHPDWAEAWNKRATLYYQLNRDDESVADIERALELEPRHFGALAGFGQIALRQGELDAAVIAFEAAVAVNPHLIQVRMLLDQLAAANPRAMH